jgi:histidinol-phosphate aminotransferase
MKISVPDYILSIKAYTPGKPIEALEREYGIDNSIKLASNENPLGPSPLALKAIETVLKNLHRYPDGSGHDPIKKISEKIGVAPHNIVLGNGSDEIIAMLVRALLKPGDEAILPRPSFLIYDIMVRSSGATPVYAPLKRLSIDLPGIKNRITSRTRMVFICNPNNPTGTVVSKKEFDEFLKSLPPEIVVVVDEAYIEFVRDPNCLNSMDYQNEDRPLVTLRTFSKAYGLAGLRIGYGVMPKELSELLNRIRLPFNANSLAQAAAAAAIDDIEFLKKTIRLVHDGLDFLYLSVDRLGLQYFPSQANFFLINVRKDAEEIFENMLRKGVIVRSMASYGYPEYIRINVGLPDENVRFVKALSEVLKLR